MSNFSCIPYIGTELTVNFSLSLSLSPLLFHIDHLYHALSLSASQKCDRPLLVDKIWRLRNIRKNGQYCRKLNEKGVETVQEFLQAYNLDAHSLQKVREPFV